jgi:hypothetical protein
LITVLRRIAGCSANRGRAGMARISGVLDNYHRIEALANALKRQGAAMVRFNEVPSAQRSDPRRGKGQK